MYLFNFRNLFVLAAHLFINLSKLGNSSLKINHFLNRNTNILSKYFRLEIQSSRGWISEIPETIRLKLKYNYNLVCTS